MATSRDYKQWPVLKHYDQDHLGRIAMPLGGIGTGTVSLGGRGDLRDWEIMNRPAKGFAPVSARAWPFFALYTRTAQGQTATRMIEGPIEPHQYEGSHGCTVPNHGLPRFGRCSFAAAYPLGQVMLSDPDVPIDVRIEAFNPLIPGDADRSGIPVAVLRYVLVNRTRRPVTAAVCGSVVNFIGGDSLSDAQQANRNTFRTGRGVRGLFMRSKGVDRRSEQWGTMALATTARTGVTYRTAWLDRGWGTSLLDFWDDLSDDGRLDDRDHGGTHVPLGSLAVRTTVPARGEKAVTFLLCWHFPNRYTWTPRTSKPGACSWDTCCDEGDRIGNYYTTQYSDAWDVAVETAGQLPRLERDTVRFVRAFCDSRLPDEVKEAALFNVAHLRTQTCFRTEDGRFYGWEGSCDQRGCCHGSCTHVWNYEQTLAFLFGDLARSMREIEFAHATNRRGLMSFRVNLPIERAQQFGKAAADGQMGCIMKMYRDWQLSGDDDLLRRLWPKVRKAVEFCWIPGGWDADRDGVMEGCQHNTMDVEYYGPNPQMGLWYLGALRAAEEMARHVGQSDFAETCRELFERGSAWIDANLFNGEYYEHQVRAPRDGKGVAACLRIGMGAADLGEPDYQLGPGCLVDQLVGQFMAHVCGLGYLVKPAHARTTLRSIMKHNLRRGFHGHFNCLRSFVLGDESALLMASYPKGRPENPFPYFTEVMTGFEYAAAIGMLYEGQLRSGIECIGHIRDRYDGRKRSPFDEAECGHHYARAMASWAAVLALSGFRYSAVSGTIGFAPQMHAHDFRCFWSVPAGWGTFSQKVSGKAFTARVEVLDGGLTVRRVELAPGPGTANARVTVNGRRVAANVDAKGRRVGVELVRPARVGANQVLQVRLTR